MSPQAKCAETDPRQGTPMRAHLQPPDSLLLLYSFSLFFYIVHILCLFELLLIVLYPIVWRWNRGKTEGIDATVKLQHPVVASHTSVPASCGISTQTVSQYVSARTTGVPQTISLKRSQCESSVQYESWPKDAGQCAVTQPRQHARERTFQVHTFG